MPIVSIIAVVIMVILGCYAHSCNGKGPSAGVAGLIALGAAGIFGLVAIFSFAFWLGQQSF